MKAGMTVFGKEMLKLGLSADEARRQMWTPDGLGDDWDAADQAKQVGSLVAVGATAQHAKRPQAETRTSVGTPERLGRRRV